MDKKDQIIKLRVTMLEKEHIQQSASDRNLSVSAYLRAELLPKHVELEDFPDTELLSPIKNSYKHTSKEFSNASHITDVLVSELLILKERTINKVLEQVFGRTPNKDDYKRCSLQMNTSLNTVDGVLTEDTLLLDGMPIGSITVNTKDKITIIFNPTEL